MGSTANGRITANVGAMDVEVLGRSGTVVGIAVLIADAGGILELRSETSTGPVKVTVQADTGGVFIPMNVHFEDGIFADIAGTTARYLIIFD